MIRFIVSMNRIILLWLLFSQVECSWKKTAHCFHSVSSQASPKPPKEFPLLATELEATFSKLALTDHYKMPETLTLHKNPKIWTRKLASRRITDKRINYDELRVATFNTEWLFAASDRWPANPRKTPEQSSRHLLEVAEVLDEVDADMVVLSELEDIDILERLRAMMSNGQDYKCFLEPGCDNSMGQNVGLLSKIDPATPLYRITCMENYPIAESAYPLVKPGSIGISKNFVSKFHIYSSDNFLHKIALFGVHLRAKPAKPLNSARREAQALALKREVDTVRAAGYDIVVAGDLNDFDTTLGESIPHVVSKSVSTIKASGGGLINPIRMINPARRYSTRSRTLVDHILVSPTLQSHSAHIYNDDRFVGVSDHFPVSVVIDLA